MTVGFNDKANILFIIDTMLSSIFCMQDITLPMCTVELPIVLNKPAIPTFALLLILLLYLHVTYLNYTDGLEIYKDSV